MDRERLARLRLIRSENVGPITYRQLLARFGSAEAALDAVPDLARRGGRRHIRVASSSECQREMDALEALGGRFLFLGLAPYPSLLARIEDAPPALAALGHLSLLDRPAVAMVGARNASAAGIRFARALASDLAEHQLVVVSGLARGIDSAAHAGAIRGGTIAVVAGGIDVVYPPENQSLYAEIRAQGLILAEQPLGTEPQARHFPRRNRIISGLSLGVIVVEAAPRSGSLITARLAAEQNREVMAVPGSPSDPRAQGANLLIREGATLVQSAADVVETLDPFNPRRQAEPESIFTSTLADSDVSDPDRTAVVALLSHAPVPVDEIMRLSGLAPAAVHTVLLELELAGRIARHAGGRVSWAE